MYQQRLIGTTIINTHLTPKNTISDYPFKIKVKKNVKKIVFSETS